MVLLLYHVVGGLSSGCVESKSVHEGALCFMWNTLARCGVVACHERFAWESWELLASGPLFFSMER